MFSILCHDCIKIKPRFDCIKQSASRKNLKFSRGRVVVSKPRSLRQKNHGVCLGLVTRGPRSRPRPHFTLQILFSIFYLLTPACQWHQCQRAFVDFGRGIYRLREAGLADASGHWMWKWDLERRNAEACRWHVAAACGHAFPPSPVSVMTGDGL